MGRWWSQHHFKLFRIHLKHHIRSNDHNHLSNQCKSEFRQQVIEKHDKRLKELTVQSKILQVAELENFNQVWKRIIGPPSRPNVFPLEGGYWHPPHSAKYIWDNGDWELTLSGHNQLTIFSPPALRHYNKEDTLGGIMHGTLQTLVKSIREHLDSETTLYADL